MWPYHSRQIDQALSRQILEKKIVKGNGNRHKKLIDKLQVKKDNYSETFD